MPAIRLKTALEALETGEVRWVAATEDGQVASGEQWPGLALLSGAFNPLHEGHRRLAEVAADVLGRPVHFELPLVNAEKAPLTPAEAGRRAAQFVGWATLILTRAPLFNHKAAIFPGSVFVVGLDTATRLVDARFYGGDSARSQAALEVLKATGCRFLVAGRRAGETFLTLKNVPVPSAYHSLFLPIPEARFRVDISSSVLRGESP